MTGLAVLAVVAAYVAVFGFVITKARNRAEKVSAIAIALSIPFWDLPYSYFNFVRRCSVEGGTHISASIPTTEAILIDGSVGYRPEDVLKFGFKTVEYISSGETIRYTAGVSGLSKSIHSSPISSIKFHFSGHELLPWNLSRTEYLVTRLNDGQIVARQTDFRWRGMWWELSSGIHFTSGRGCPGEREKPLLAALAPSR